jgi:hypothetical protein
MGTNLIFDRISFITQATAAILQLACSWIIPSFFWIA